MDAKTKIATIAQSLTTRLRVDFQAILAVAAASLCASLAFALAPEDPPDLELQRLKSHVEQLASPKYEGRRGAGAKLAAEFIAQFFRENKIAPLFDSKYEQYVPGGPGKPNQGTNVGAKLVGSDPKLKDEWIVLSAHFDHLGVRNGTLFPGADDDASGIAMLLETARTLAALKDKPKRSIMFVAFDLEEIGLFGSRHFANDPPVPIESIKFFITADMIGRSLAGVCDRYVFVMGSEHAPISRKWLEDSSAGLDLSVGLLGSDVVGTRSDYGPFRTRRIPFLFFSTGENPAYHSPKDRPETIDYAKLTKIACLMERVVWRSANSNETPEWSEKPQYVLAEVRTIREVVAILLEHADDLQTNSLQQSIMKNTIDLADDVLKRGAMTPAERSKLVRNAQIILFTVVGKRK